jgi:hypothetical protein
MVNIRIRSVKKPAGARANFHAELAVYHLSTSTTV